jgi:hypothetical protein
VPPKESSQLAVAHTGPGSFTSKFAVARSGGSVPRFSRLGGANINAGFGVDASAGSYSAALLQSNLKLLLERNTAAADALAAPSAVPTPGLPVVSFSSASILPQEQQHNPLNARAALFGNAAAAAGGRSMGSRSVNLGASGYWVSVVCSNGNAANADPMYSTTQRQNGGQKTIVCSNMNATGPASCAGIACC